MDADWKKEISAQIDDLVGFGYSLRDATDDAERIALFVAIRNRARLARGRLLEVPREPSTRSELISSYDASLAEIERQAAFLVDGFPELRYPDRWVREMAQATANASAIKDALLALDIGA